MRGHVLTPDAEEQQLDTSEDRDDRCENRKPRNRAKPPFRPRSRRDGMVVQEGRGSIVATRNVRRVERIDDIAFDASST